MISLKPRLPAGLDTLCRSRTALAMLASVGVCGIGCGARDSLDSSYSEAVLSGGASGATVVATGGSGTSTGGASPMPTGGRSATGGSFTGGMNTGGSFVSVHTGGRVATGGMFTGGVATGGVATGGVATGGVATGGVATGGVATGGVATGGTSSKPLWRNSAKPFCAMTSENATFVDVWSDSRGVYLLSTDDNGVSPPRISRNLGNGWETSYTWPSGSGLLSGGLTGFVNGPLIVYPGPGACRIQFIDGSNASCSSAAPDAEDVSVVDSTLAYSIYRDRLLKYDGQLWTQLGGPLQPAGETYAYALWADATVIAIAAAAGRVYLVQPGSEPVLQKGLPEVDFTAVWGFGPTDIWIGSVEGQLYHYDGANWTLKWEVAGECNAITKLWGSKGVLFVMTRSLVAKWSGSGLDSVATLGCNDTSSFYGMWGNSPTELFFTFRDLDKTAAGCGAEQIRWYNGAVVSEI